MKTTFTPILFILILSSCKLIDLRTSVIHSDPNEVLELKGRKLLAESVKAMGYNHLTEFSTYETTVNFKWRFPWSIMPMNAFPGTGKNGRKSHEFDFIPNTFDGTITYAKSGKVYGLQSWQSYQKIDNQPVKFKKDKRRSWGLGTWHYLLESPYRLLTKAPVIKYAGKEKLGEITYEKVFITWGQEAPIRNSIIGWFILTLQQSS